MIAEDQRLFRKALIQLLHSLGNIKITGEFSNGKELLATLRGTAVLPDVVLLDLNMEELNGVETTKLLREGFPGIKIVVLSLYYEAPIIVKMVQLGINAYLPKNCEPQEVKETILKVVENDFYFSNAVLGAIRSDMMHPETGKTKNPFEGPDYLTRREQEVLRLICLQYTTTEIADKLFISKRTVDGHRNNLLEKTASKNAAGLVLYAVKNKMIDLTESLIGGGHA